MVSPRQVRLPVQTGAATLRVEVGGLLVLGAFLGGLLLFTPLLGGLVAILFFVGVVLISTCIWLLCLKNRANDLLISSDFLVIEGGQHNGVRIERSMLEGERAGLEENRGQNGALLSVTFYLYLGHGIRYRLGEASNAEEIESLRALVGTVQAWSSSASLSSSPAVAPSGASVLVCEGCGAPLAPQESSSVVCHRCGAATPVGGELSQRIQAARLLPERQARSDALVRTLLRQPGAHLVNVLLLVQGVLLYVAVPWGAWAGGLWGGLAALAIAVAAGLVFRIVTTSRGALRLLHLQFSAVAPRVAGDPEQCRRCGGPLPGSEHLVACCVYCGAENVLGFDVRKQYEATTLGVEELQSLSQRRRGAQLRGLVAAAVGIAIAAWAVPKIQRQREKEEAAKRDVDLFGQPKPSADPTLVLSELRSGSQAQSPKRLTPEEEEEKWMTLSSDRQRMLVMRSAKREATDGAVLLIREVDSGREVLYAEAFLSTTSKSRELWATFSPDQESVLFVRQTWKGGDAESSEILQLVLAPKVSLKPIVVLPGRWAHSLVAAPQGKLYAYAESKAVFDKDQVEVRSVDGSVSWSLCEGRPAGFSAEGKSLLVLRDEPGSSPLVKRQHLYLREGERLQNERRLTAGPSNEAHAALSPDGSLLAFSSTPDRTEVTTNKLKNDLWVLDQKSNSMAQVTYGRVNDGPVAWGDAQTVYFVSLGKPGGKAGVYRVRLQPN